MVGILQNIKGDRAIWVISLFMALASILLVYSSIVTLAYKHSDGNTLRYLFKHGFFLASGLYIMYLIHLVKYVYFSRLSLILLYISVPLLAVTLLVGTNINEASRWLTIPVINQTFQTSDFAKLALIMYLARILSLKQEDIKDFNKAFLPSIVPVIIICALIFPANFSTAAVLFVCCMVLMFIGGISFRHLLSLLFIGVVMIGMALMVAKFAPALFPRAETWMKRVESFQKGESKGNYQVEQAKIAIATGGITGKGPGNSTQRNFLPHPYSDFIFAIVLEEYGIIGGIGVLFLYFMLLLRCVRVAAKCEKSFGSLLVMGISILLVFQALINMAVAVNLLPVTGQPLPLMSMGGTSIWFTCAALGIILSVSREVEESELKTKAPIDNKPDVEPLNNEDYAIA
jgi:cell division protein FtsW